MGQGMAMLRVWRCAASLCRISGRSSACRSKWPSDTVWGSKGVGEGEADTDTDTETRRSCTHTTRTHTHTHTSCCCLACFCRLCACQAGERNRCTSQGTLQMLSCRNHLVSHGHIHGQGARLCACTCVCVPVSVFVCDLLCCSRHDRAHKPACMHTTGSARGMNDVKQQLLQMSATATASPNASSNNDGADGADGPSRRRTANVASTSSDGSGQDSAEPVSTCEGRWGREGMGRGIGRMKAASHTHTHARTHALAHASPIPPPPQSRPASATLRWARRSHTISRVHRSREEHGLISALTDLTLVSRCSRVSCLVSCVHALCVFLFFCFIKRKPTTALFLTWGGGVSPPLFCLRAT